MKVFKPALVIWIIVLALLFSFSPQALFAQSKYSISTESFPLQGSEQGECVKLVRKLRPDVDTTVAPTDPETMAAFTMFENAKQKGVLQTGKVPRVGAVIVWGEKFAEDTGHVGIVKEIKADGTIVVIDSNLGRDHKVQETPYEKDEYEKQLKDGKILGFIYERKEIYNKKITQIDELVDGVYRYLLDRTVDESGKQFYKDMLLSGKTINDVENSIRNSDEYRLKTRLTNVAKSVVAKRTGSEIPALSMPPIEMKTAMTTPAFLAPGIDTSTETSQNQTTKNVEDTGTLSTGGGDRPTTHYGYYVGMVTKDDVGSRSYADDVVTDSRQNFDSSNIMVGDNADTYHILDGSQDYNDPTITSMKVQGRTVISGLPVAVEHEEYGYNPSMEWGRWVLNDLVFDGQYNYYVDNKGWYVFGDVTTNNQMDYLAAKNISAAYTGKSYGTYWIGPGGYLNKVKMEGTFSSDVSFSSRTISNFDLSVSGDGHNASISNASGSFSGSSSHFALDGNSGQWKIDGISAGVDDKGGYGSVYGPNGERIGGVWGMHNDASNKHAVGAFKGNK